MKPCLRLVLKAVGDYPHGKYMGGWDALCTTQQRAFHGQSVDPLTGVRLRQCNPKLFNQITRAWEEKIGPLNNAWGRGYVARYGFQCQCDLFLYFFAPRTPHTDLPSLPPAGETQESAYCTQSGEVCAGCGFNPHNLILSTHFIGDVISRSSGKSQKLYCENANSSTQCAICERCLFGRRQTSQTKKTGTFILKSERALPKNKSFFAQHRSCMKHYRLFGKTCHIWAGPRPNKPAKWLLLNHGKKKRGEKSPHLLKKIKSTKDD